MERHGPGGRDLEFYTYPDQGFFTSVLGFISLRRHRPVLGASGNLWTDSALQPSTSCHRLHTPERSCLDFLRQLCAHKSQRYQITGFYIGGPVTTCTTHCPRPPCDFQPVGWVPLSRGFYLQPPLDTFPISSMPRPGARHGRGIDIFLYVCFYINEILQPV